METESTRQSLDRLSIDTAANINEDVTLASEFSADSRYKQPESVFSLRTSIDGNSGYINNFNILKQGAGQDDDFQVNSSTILGPNSIFDLTQALDSARIKLNKALRSQVSVNGGSQTFYNLTKPSTRDIPPIQLQPLKQKVSNDTFTKELINDVSDEYKAFELSYNPLTADVLSDFSKLYNEAEDSNSEAVSEEGNNDYDIPEVFEDPNFRLDDPRVFRQVMQHSKILQDSESSESNQLVNNSEVQDKLLQYLDTVEMQLITEISKTSDSFFTTLGDIKEIKSQSKNCVKKLSTISSKLSAVENSQSKVGLEILNLLDEARSVSHLETSLLQLKEVLKGIDETCTAFEEGKNLECLEKIIVTENLIEGVEYEDYPDPDTISNYPRFKHPLVNMIQLPAIQNGRNKLSELKSSCSRGYINEFLELLIENLRSHYRSVPTRDTINRIYAASDRARKYDQSSLNKSFMTISQETKDSLRVFIQNLTKSGNLVEAFSRYQESIITEVKTIIRYGLPMEGHAEINNRIQAVAIDSQGSSNTSEIDISLSQENKNVTGGVDSKRGTLSGNIKTLSNSAFDDMMATIFARLSECLRRLTSHQKLLLDLSLTSLSNEDSQKVDVMSLDITGAINKAIEITQVRIVKVLNVRLEQLGDLSINEYLKLFLLSSAYLLECESINPGFNSSDLGRSFNEWLRNHVGYFLHRFHSNSVKNLANACDKETWKEYTGEEIYVAQRSLDEIISYSEFVRTGEGFDGSKWSDSMLDIYQGEVKAEPENGTGTNTESKNSETKIEVSGTSFFIPHLIIDIIKTTGDYIILSRIFGYRASNIMQNLLTYLKVSNSRVSLAILNAGATRTAGLKHITTKHLALCIQTVDFLGVYSTIIQEIFRPVTDTRDASETPEQPTFTTTINHFKDHKNELVSKLVSIMHDRTLSHCNAIKALDLSKSVSHPQQCRPYMETLVKETLTVSKVIGKYLSSPDCSLIMLRIFDNYKKLLVSCYCAELPQLKDFNEKHSLLKDIDFFRVKLGEIDGYGNSGQVIWENVNSLPTVEDMAMEEKMRQNIESEKSNAESEENATKRTSEDQENTDAPSSNTEAKITRQSIEVENSKGDDESDEATGEKEVE